MTIGTSYFGDLAIRSFSRLQGDVADIQGQISSGKNDPRPSADPLRAAQLSALAEQRGSLKMFQANAEEAANKLALTDQALGAANDIMQQMQEIALQAANDILPAEGYAGLRAKAVALRDAMIETANRRDSLGQPLFSGYGDEAFRTIDGKTTYVGDEGHNVLKLSETLNQQVSLNGAEVFGVVKTPKGPISAFEAIDNLIASLQPALAGANEAWASEGGMELTLNTTRQAQPFSMQLKGPLGVAEISADVVRDVPGPLVDAVNAVSERTGVTARIADDGVGVILETIRGSDVVVSDLKLDVQPGQLAGYARDLDESGAPKSDIHTLLPVAYSNANVLEGIQATTGHMAVQRATAGSLAAAVDSQAEALEFRSIQIEKAVAGLEDLDIAAAVTRLQELLLSQEASQQTFVRITQTSLFDYIR
ncbi:flagellar hook-associated protein FlgL [Pelagovum sp. HNIBRBA483]|uniref:flagellar hook-associated protein FlgL n=1 Tax=Pelagovum sp. HNIBRBA483 TaxID=3233341 RepID=UPI0034A300F4